MNASRRLQALSLVALLAACNGALEVVDDTPLDEAGAGIGVGEAESPPAGDAPCGCASSPVLTALGCEASGDEITELSGFPHITPDGSVVAFGVCRGDQFDAAGDCDVLHWRAETGARVVAQGVVNGLAPDGSALLITSTTLASSDESILLEAYGTGIQVPIRPFFVRSLSADGSTVVGYETVDGAPYVARWSEAARLERLAPLPIDQRAFVTAFDDTAATLTGALQFADGRGANARYEPFRITAAGLSTGLGALPTGATGAVPSGISADGSVIAGVTMGLGSVFRWTEASGIVELAPVGQLYSEFTGVSADGEVVSSTLDPQGSISSSAFRWTAASGAVPLTPGSTSRALFMSRAGNVIVGEIVAAEPSIFVWDEANGVRELIPTLEALDVDLSGWELGEVRALSADGNALVGIGTCGGVPTHYRVEL